jgi:hypothetical protein
VTDNSDLSPQPISNGLMCLLRAQLQAEFELAHAQPRWPPWRTDTPPDEPRTYLCRCINGDGDTYVATHYWCGRWASAGPFVAITGYMETPPL